jgi:hypothetical protein
MASTHVQDNIRRIFEEVWQALDERCILAALTTCPRIAKADDLENLPIEHFDYAAEDYKVPAADVIPAARLIWHAIDIARKKLHADDARIDDELRILCGLLPNAIQDRACEAQIS